MPTSTKVALVTGAGSGVGRSAALALAGEGYAVVLSGRRKEMLEAVAQGGRAGAPDAGRAHRRRRSRLGPRALRPDQGGRSAGSTCCSTTPASARRRVPLEDLTYEQWKAVVDTNLTGSFLCTQEAFKIMKNQEPRGGRIINNGSISAHAPRPNSSPYTSTKHAITGLTKSTSLDGRKYDIACGQIDIGNAETPMTARMKKGVPQPNGAVEVEPTMDVENVARAVVYMASLPLDANVLFMTVMATKMPFVGRG